MEPQVQAGGVEDNGVDDTEREGRYAITVVVLWTPIVASRIEIDHV